jgi:hypothetical protein
MQEAIQLLLVLKRKSWQQEGKVAPVILPEAPQPEVQVVLLQVLSERFGQPVRMAETVRQVQVFHQVPEVPVQMEEVQVEQL